MKITRAAVLMLVLAAAWPAAAAANSATFTDPSGDGGNAPDVRSVEVALDDAANLTFAVHASSPDLWAGAGASLMIDADANYATGHSDGVDYLVTLHRDHTADFGRWNGSDFPSFGASFSASLDGATLKITFPWRAIGSPGRIAFAVITFDASDAGDQAPDGSFAPGTPPRWTFSPAAAPTVKGLTARFSTARPVHGKRFALTRATAVLSNGRSRATSATCSATLAGKPLGSGCAWRIPTSAKGKRLVVTIHAGAVSRRYAFVVR
jgi:hypothetical protein